MNEREKTVAEMLDEEPVAVPSLSLAQFVEALEQLDGPVELPTLKELLGRLKTDCQELERFKQFSQERYQRNLVAENEHFEALLLCFEAGQRTPIHDHQGSACGVKVIDGTAMETIVEATPDGWLYPTCTQSLPAGGVVGSVDMDIHQLSNLQTDGRRLVTLHIYTPPLREVGNYSIDNNSKSMVTAPRNIIAD